MEFREDINGLRAIAVLSVVLYHFGVPAFGGGFIGVDVFFVISGYLLTGIARRDLEVGRYSVIRFLSNRLRRIFPALCAVLAACVLWATYSYLPGDYKRIVRDATSALVIRSNYAFVDNAGYFAPDARQNILLHTWSLSVESQFYLVFALLCGVFWPRSGQFARKVGFALFSALGVASLGWCLVHTPGNQPASFYLLWSRAWEFMAGSMVSIYGARNLRIAHANTLASIGAISLTASIVGLDSAMPYPGWRALFPVMGTMLIIYAKRGYIAQILSTTPFQFVGRISYSVYLWHWPLLVAFRERTGVDPSRLQIILLLVASLAVGWMSFQFVEQPTRRRARNSHLAGALVTAIAAGFIFSGVLSWNQGWPQRLPAYLQQAVAGREEPNPLAAECMRQADGTKRSPGDFCRLGDPGDTRPPVVMLWGDSFASGLQPTVSSIVSDLGVPGILASEGGCPPFIGAAFKGSGAEIFPGCENYANFTFKYFERTPSISLVVVAGDWKRYNADYEGRVLKKIAEILAARGGRMVILGAVPDPQGDVPHLWAHAQFQAGHAIDELTVPRASQTELLDKVEQIVGPALKVGNGTVVEPFKSLCSDDFCYSVKGNRALFMDTDHLNTAGLAYVKPLMKTAITHARNEIEAEADRQQSGNSASVAFVKHNQPGKLRDRGGSPLDLSIPDQN
ncbi:MULTISPECIES: acyltransferase family protein [Paraburkholderia]|uniref:acyltransferase family protein n=1 Tax=Paraburkholderia TaxID=1822464 RepID=UPI0003A0C415|nr:MULTISPECIES: acyltransferase family protein [Paraburkholderia]MDH6151808.1 peptidoglycan/LPS O-acetylase OafA/YrhL [Paraburkholderia sp. WSM4179]